MKYLYLTCFIIYSILVILIFKTNILNIISYYCYMVMAVLSLIIFIGYSVKIKGV